MKLSLVTPPASEPVSTVDAKLHLRIDLSFISDDGYIGALIAAARAWVEEVCGRAFVTQTWDLYLDRWPARNYIELPLPPLQSVDSLTYYDTDSTAYTLTEDTEFTVDTASQFGRIVLEDDETWPTVSLHPNNPIVIRFTSGYLDTSSPPSSVAGVPAPVKQAIKMLAAHWYTNRMAVTADGMGEIPMGVKALIAPYRAYGWHL